MTTIPNNSSDLIVDRKLSTEQQLAALIREVLSRMTHSYNPKTGNHSFEPSGPIVMTAELKGTIDGILDSVNAPV